MPHETILIVDDEPTNLGVLLGVLESRDVKVLIATRGEFALQTLTKVQPDLILLDVIMPGLNGFEVCRRLKANAATQAIPVIFMTALTETVDEVQGLSVGAVDYITKPFQLETALARIHTHLALRQAQKQMEEHNVRLQQEIAERRRAEEALADERNLLRTVIDHLPDYIFVKDTSGRFMLNNAAHVRKLGAATPDEVFGETDFDRFPKEFATQSFADEQQVLQTGEPLLNHEELAPTPDSKLQWLLTTKVPLRNRQGAMIGLVGISRDISPLKQMYAELGKSEERYRQLVELSPDGIVVHQADQFVYVNAAAVKLLGAAQAEDLLGKTIWEVIHPDCHALARERIRQTYAEGKTVGFFEYKGIRLDGQILDVELASAPTMYQGVSAIQSVFKDITERKRMEVALAEERNLLRLLINTLPDHIYIKDLHSRFLLANNAAIQSLGLNSLDELVGKTDFDLFPAEVAARYYADEAALLASGQMLSNKEELNLAPSSGGSAWYVSTRVPFRDLQGNPVGLVGINHDITERKRAEEQLRLAHQELQIRNAQLQELNASKDKFFSIVAHDLRSPFNALLGYMELINDQFDRLSPDRLKDYLGRLRQSADRLYALLENLLTWSRIQRGMMEYRPESFDLRELVVDTVTLFNVAAEGKQLTLRNTLPDVIEVYADYAMINTVLRNLISNALKFTPAGGQITISAQPAEQNVIVAVTDTGVGMSPAAMANVFRIDAQFTTVGTAGETGTGLGLLLCHDLMQKNGGQLWIESELGQGTTFRLTLPQSPPP